MKFTVLKSGKMAMLKRQGLGLMRALLVLVGISALCSVAVGTRRGNVSLDQRGHRHRHSGMAKAKRLSLSFIYLIPLYPTKICRGACKVFSVPGRITVL